MLNFISEGQNGLLLSAFETETVSCCAATLSPAWTRSSHCDQGCVGCKAFLVKDYVFCNLICENLEVLYVYDVLIVPGFVRGEGNSQNAELCQGKEVASLFLAREGSVLYFKACLF